MQDPVFLSPSFSLSLDASHSLHTFLTSPQCDFIPSFTGWFFSRLWFLNSVCIAPPSAFVLWRNCLKRNTLSGNYAFIGANILPSELVPVEWIGRFACLTLDTLKSFTKSGLMCTLNFPWLRRNSAAQKTCDLKPPCENLAILWPVTKLTVVPVEPGWYLSCWVLR